MLNPLSNVLIISKIKGLRFFCSNNCDLTFTFYQYAKVLINNIDATVSKTQVFYKLFYFTAQNIHIIGASIIWPLVVTQSFLFTHLPPLL